MKFQTHKWMFLTYRVTGSAKWKHTVFNVVRISLENIIPYLHLPHLKASCLAVCCKLNFLPLHCTCDITDSSVLKPAINACEILWMRRWDSIDSGIGWMDGNILLRRRDHGPSLFATTFVSFPQAASSKKLQPTLQQPLRRHRPYVQIDAIEAARSSSTSPPP